MFSFIFFVFSYSYFKFWRRREKIGNFVILIILISKEKGKKRNNICFHFSWEFYVLDLNFKKEGEKRGRLFIGGGVLFMVLVVIVWSPYRFYFDFEEEVKIVEVLFRRGTVHCKNSLLFDRNYYFEKSDVMSVFKKKLLYVRVLVFFVYTLLYI